MENTGLDFIKRLGREIEKIEEGNYKTADEIFKELGYYLEDNLYEINTYQYINVRKNKSIKFIDNCAILVSDMKENFCEIATIGELKAINKKCEELGWI